MKYRVAALVAASDGAHMLWLDLRCDPEAALLEPVVLFVAVESADGEAEVLPVPMSLANNATPLDDLVAISAQSFWECRTSDVDAALSRLGSAFGCTVACGWSVESDATAPGVGFRRHHRPPCEQETT
jgi:hypothetical protein